MARKRETTTLESVFVDFHRIQLDSQQLERQTLLTLAVFSPIVNNPATILTTDI